VAIVKFCANIKKIRLRALKLQEPLQKAIFSILNALFIILYTKRPSYKIIRPKSCYITKQNVWYGLLQRVYRSIVRDQDPKTIRISLQQ